MKGETKSRKLRASKEHQCSVMSYHDDERVHIAKAKVIVATNTKKKQETTDCRHR